jgi:CRP-like cAMP-binding protein
MNIQALIKYFEQFLPLDEIEKTELENVVIEKHFKRKQYLLQTNQICDLYSFVVSGLFKMYGTDKNGIEHIIQFASENQWVEDMNSLHKKTPSQLCIEAIEPSVVLQIKKEDMHQLLSRFPKFERNFRVIHENKYMEIENRLLQNISAGAEEKYISFMQQFPEISNRIPNTLIASYLGITPEFLSKIRGNITKK